MCPPCIADWRGERNVACARSDLCKVVSCFILLEYSLIGRRVASAWLGKPEIISSRASGVFLLAGLRGPNPHRITPYSLSGIVAFKMGSRRGYIFCERPAAGIAGWRGGWIECIASEGTRPALLPAGPVPERWGVKAAFIETPHGPAINWTSWLGYFLL